MTQADSQPRTGQDVLAQAPGGELVVQKVAPSQSYYLEEEVCSQGVPAHGLAQKMLGEWESTDLWGEGREESFVIIVLRHISLANASGSVLLA